ncbi:serine/threonine-protein kinase S6KL [Contarinia nasturtii]|uniref:serine/threonine-protein kinase S6KL n=1 Tax=Contarinia nasturtii TaxID=265458 RepID=UPI0012D43C22|nr:serine/threonine-protein kinase S6KL [Contarinia nasturtii]
MGNSISRSANQSAHENQPNTNSNRIRFSESLSSLSNFTNKYRFGSRRSYSLSTIDPIFNQHQEQTTTRPLPKSSSHQRFARSLAILNRNASNLISRSHSHLVNLSRSLPHVALPRFLTRSTSTLSPEELAFSSRSIWPTPTIVLLFSPQFKRINLAYLHEKYEFHGIIASGAFGTVVRCIDRNEKKEYALKVLEKSQIIRDKAVRQLKNEVDIQSVCGHNTFIVKLISFWQSHREIYLLSEYIGGGELFDTIRKFPYKLIQLYVAEIALALDFLHNAGVIYRDLKSENILLDDKFHIKLTDFGLSKFLKIGQSTNTICGTLQYMAPEIILGIRSGNFVTYDHSVDWYALGVVACRMLTNQFPEVIEAEMVTSTSNPTSIYDCTDNARANTDGDYQMPISPTLPILKSECNDHKFNEGSVRLPVECSALPSDGRDLLLRLLAYRPEHRIRSIFALQRIAFFMGFNFDDAKKKKINPLDLMDSTEII